MKTANEYQDLASKHMHKVFDNLDNCKSDKDLSLELLDEISQAMLCLNKIEEIDLDNNQDDLRVIAFTTMSTIYLDGLEDYAKARKSAIKAIELDVHNVDLYILMAEIDLASGNISDAVQAIDAALEMDPGSVEALRVREIIDNKKQNKEGFFKRLFRRTPEIETTEEIEEYLSNFEFELDCEDFTAAFFTTGNILLAYRNIRNKKQVKKWIKIQKYVQQLGDLSGGGWWKNRKTKKIIKAIEKLM